MQIDVNILYNVALQELNLVNQKALEYKAVMHQLTLENEKLKQELEVLKKDIEND